MQTERIKRIADWMEDRGFSLADLGVEGFTTLEECDEDTLSSIEDDIVEHQAHEDYDDHLFEESLIAELEEFDETDT
jgi:hypothetical protein